LSLKDKKFHFVGIGGIGMCGLAELLATMGAQVAGSDLSENANTQKLKSLGVKIYKGHSGEHIEKPDVVVYSSAVPPSNPELVRARELHIPAIPRAEALAEIMRLKRGLAVAGTHGKTTTTSMTSAIFLNAGLEPTIVVGGRFELIESTARLGKGEWLIAEADESDGSFAKLSPEIAIITNIDNDHLEYYKTFENVQKAFFQFSEKVPFYGSCIICGDDENTRKLFAHYPKKKIFYGFHDQNDYVVAGENGRYQISAFGKKLGDFKIPVPGKHNALNATAAIIAGLSAGISFDKCVAGLLKFNGVDRRFQLKGEVNKIKIYDDYGHHPTEVVATLSAFKEKYPNNRLVVLFQPHRYSRTQSCWNEFLNCFQLADVLNLTDIYSAGESPLPGVHSSELAKQIKGANYLPKDSDLTSKIIKQLKQNDIFVTLGAGDGWKIGMEILEGLSQNG
jgi:UDP-N-acetylmuramate--alanine ligase